MFQVQPLKQKPPPSGNLSFLIHKTDDKHTTTAEDHSEAPVRWPGNAALHPIMFSKVRRGCSCSKGRSEPVAEPG